MRFNWMVRDTTVFTVVSVAATFALVGPLALLVMVRESSWGPLVELGKTLFPADSRLYLYLLAGALVLSAVAGPLGSRFRVWFAAKTLMRLVSPDWEASSNRKDKQYVRQLRAYIDEHFDLSQTLVRLPLIILFGLTLGSVTVAIAFLAIVIVAIFLLPIRLRGGKGEFERFRSERLEKEARHQLGEGSVPGQGNFLDWVAFKRALRPIQLFSLVAPVGLSLWWAISSGEVVTLQELLIHSAVTVLFAMGINDALVQSAHYRFLSLSVKDLSEGVSLFGDAFK